VNSPLRERTNPGDTRAPAARLSRTDRLLPVWIATAMAAGLLLGRLVGGLSGWLSALKVGQSSLPIALGLLAMMYPVLAKVRYHEIRRVTADKPMMAASLVLNWVIGPALMFALAWLLLPDQPAYRTGVILVALNALFQVTAYAALAVFYLRILPGWLGLERSSLNVSIGAIAATVAIFLGIPLVAGYLTRLAGEHARGRDWYERTFLPRLAPLALYGQLFTVVVLFALQGETITARPLDVARIALPLLAYFTLMWFGTFALGRRLHLPYPRTATLAFCAASNDFELAIAVAVGVFGATSGQALAGVVGPLIEVPVLLALVYAALWARRHLRWTQETQ
jgi:ACR3 family arsenite transporter